MNERLRDLMLQAGYAAPELAGRAQKLAELIVRECTNIILHYTDVDEGVAVAKKQFGVEE